MMQSDVRISMLPQCIVESFDYSLLPSDWIPSDLSEFSPEKSLYSYQQDALMNCAKCLYSYYGRRNNASNPDELKKAWFNALQERQRYLTGQDGALDTLRIDSRKDNGLFETLKGYYQSEARTDEAGTYECIPFWNYVNRIGFWMATGSGKSIVLIKLIEILDEYQRRGLVRATGEVKRSDILILSYREDLLFQLRLLIREYNKGRERRIDVWDLKDYDRVRTGRALVDESRINVFMHRSDLISDVTTEANLSFEDVDNDGRWLILLDEAHKGDLEESKRQQYYSILSRNGFLFNFSATFTDPWDLVTVVFNFNLSEFIQDGYGKNVYLMHDEDDLRVGKEMDLARKRSIVLQMLVLLSYVKKCREELESSFPFLQYHNPLLVILGKTVNTADADLEVMFTLLQEAATGHIEPEELEAAKKELGHRFDQHGSFCFGDERFSFAKSKLESIGLRDILTSAFHSTSPGAIEVLRNPSDPKQIAFKLKTSDRPFALLKIGDITIWLTQKLRGYETVETFDDRSYFDRLNDEDSPIAILMGAQAFYEGWDSNRPNIMAFINIGKGDAKKYVIQAIGRGIRIEPVEHKRKRLIHLTSEMLPSGVQFPEPHLPAALETLFVFGTSEKNIERLLEGIRYVKPRESAPLKLRKNPAIESLGMPLLVPVYAEASNFPIAELPMFSGNGGLLQRFSQWMDDDVVLYALMCTQRGQDVPLSTLESTRSFIRSGRFVPSDDSDVLRQLRNLTFFVESRLEDLDSYKELEHEIVHFEQVSTTLDEADTKALQEAMERVADYRDPQSEKTRLMQDLKEGKISDSDFDKRFQELTRVRSMEQIDSVGIMHMSAHYYLPLLLSEDGKGQYIKHIIRESSERQFIGGLATHILREDNVFSSADSWMFSKIVEQVDDVFIPYYSRVHNRVRRYYPDFVFWIRKGSRYHIVFLDPKGTAHSDYQEKIDGFVRIFWKDGRPKVFAQGSVEIVVHLRMYGSRSEVAEGYRSHWIDDIAQFADLLNE